MNILHMKYAVEVAETGSINKAAEQLAIAQPNLSRSIKKLESDLGIIIFDRSSRGMALTPEGEEFIDYARNILHQVDELESRFRSGLPLTQKFSISVPRASYIAYAFTRFTLHLTQDPAEIFYQETSSLQAISNIIHSDYKLGIIRYDVRYDQYFQRMLEEKNMVCHPVVTFQYMLIMSPHHPLAKKEKIYFADLEPYIEIAHADTYNPTEPVASPKHSHAGVSTSRKIFVYERGSQFDLLENNHETFMWVSPIPTPMLKHTGLVQRVCVDNRREFKDVLIRRRNYTVSELDRKFIETLYDSREKYL